ncbi:F-box only protein 8-like [Rutidosis leptorrhynchoides]|uniref:F-box only protein 8-like n=1 Tax=Rutidosis leptorrhynchoides TaxID=125765 RepID=UPI003A9A3EAA
MSNYIASVIQIKIFCHLHVKSLVRFRSVSKEWKSLIDSSEFNSDYIISQAKRCRLLLSGRYHKEGEYCLIVDDDDSFPQHNISLSNPLSFNQLLNMKQKQIEFVGSSYGLLCFTRCYLSKDGYFNRYVIWNPAIRKSIAIDALYCKRIYVGFGVCPNTLDPKIVRINIISVESGDIEYDDDLQQYVSRLWRVEVFTLSGGVWRSPLTKLPRKWFNIGLCYQTPLVVNGFIYWCAFINGISDYINMIVSFDLGSEKFAKVQVPSNLAEKCFEIFKLRNSLGVVQIDCTSLEEKVHNVWSMDHFSKLFTKLYSVTLPQSSKVVGFRDNEQLIIEKTEERLVENGVRGYVTELVAYESNSKQFNDLGLYVRCSSFSSYTESLLLLDQSGTLNDDEGDDEHTTRFVDHEC